MTEPERAAALKSVQLELVQLKNQVIALQRKQKRIERRLKVVMYSAGIGTKVCRQCQIEMDLEQFYKDLQKSDGRDSYCVECRGMRNKISRCLRKAA